MKLAFLLSIGVLIDCSMAKKRCVLISGRSLCDDEELYEALQNIALVMRSQENRQVESMMAKRSVDLILLETSKEHSAGVELIKGITHQFPDTIIIVVDGDADREVIAQAFAYGAKDAFRRPYKRALIIERVKALLSCMF